MFCYLFLLAAAIATSELPTIDLTQAEEKAVQEIIAVLAQEEDVVTITAEIQETTSMPVAIEAKPIVITNAIESSMLEYKHWTGKHSPESFAVTINGAEIELGKTMVVPANARTIEIGYTYSFMNGMKSGGRKISYKLDENSTHAQITFNWKDDWRIILDNGKAIQEISS